MFNFHVLRQAARTPTNKPSTMIQKKTFCFSKKKRPAHLPSLPHPSLVTYNHHHGLNSVIRLQNLLAPVPHSHGLDAVAKKRAAGRRWNRRPCALLAPVAVGPP